MILYHFCADKHVKSIMREGLTIGGICEMKTSGVVLHSGWSWLTLCDDPNAQSWAKNQTLISYSRTAWRVTIEIPENQLHRLYDRERLTDEYPSTSLLFRGFEGNEQWRVFHGRIPVEWIICAEKMGGAPPNAPDVKAASLIEQLPGQLDMFGGS